MLIGPRSLEKVTRISSLLPALRIRLCDIILPARPAGQRGVIVTHSGLLNYLSWAARSIRQEARRSALVHSSLSFDLTVTGLYAPLLVGGQVELLPEDASVEAVVRALRQPQTRGLV
jgi:non-ribosomal peptide synthetase component F